MLLLVVMTIVTSLGERALYFSPSDVDFLFPAPFSRRQILVYKILGSVTAAIYIALIFPVSLAIYIRSWPAAAVGCFLAWLMINSLTHVRPARRPERDRTGFYAGPQIAPRRSDRGRRRGAGPGGRPRAQRPLAADLAAGTAFARGRNPAGALHGLRQDHHRRAIGP